ncbi:amidohydrolase family protein [Actinopolymorpha alba]|uniref:amidohydrolase family protein n=1 Tax=Actinopolymorpha alba TaxID=533267 RepID=UPI001ED9B16D|nr:amidohydrolase family protein [Actinopolymorpha alba]
MSAAGAPGPAPLHVRGVVLPEGDHRDLYVVDGRVTYERVAGAETVAVGYVVPGLVDAHCHVGLDADGAVPPAVQEEQALADRDAGTLLIRDAGSAADTRWIDDRADLPHIIRAGRHVARSKRYIRNYGVEIEPHELVDTVADQTRRGDGWVKLVGDWIDRDAGDLTPCWPGDALAAAIAKAHELGARVTAHVFGEEALPDLLAAGIDCLEHGTGLSPELVAIMAERQVALVPTRRQVDNFPRYADQGEPKFPAYAVHMRELYGRVDETLRAAYAAGVPIYAGTDAGGVLPHGLIATEIRMLHERVGLSAYDALGAGSWRAREWLGLNAGLHEGAPADFVVYADNPLDNLGVLAAPARIVLRGAVVR